jgi:hypothetical protein
VAAFLAAVVHVAEDLIASAVEPTVELKLDYVGKGRS